MRNQLTVILPVLRCQCYRLLLLSHLRRRWLFRKGCSASLAWLRSHQLFVRPPGCLYHRLIRSTKSVACNIPSPGWLLAVDRFLFLDHRSQDSHCTHRNWYLPFWRFLLSWSRSCTIHLRCRSVSSVHPHTWYVFVDINNLGLQLPARNHLAQAAPGIHADWRFLLLRSLAHRRILLRPLLRS